MVAIIPPQTVLTAGDAANQLQSQGLDALGLTVPNLSSAWAATVAPVIADYSASNLTLQVTGLLAPFRGILTHEPAPTFWSQPSGAPVAGAIAVLRLHPEAAQRLRTLAASRYGTPVVRPVPVAMVIRGLTAPTTPQPINWYRAGEALPATTALVVSFHDGRGLPIDPLAVASMFADLLGFLPGLRIGDPGMPAIGAAGGLTGIVALKSGVRCHVIDPHGWAYLPPRPVGRLRVLNASNATLRDVPDSGLVDLASGETIGRSTADDGADTARPLRWGLATNGTLARTAVAIPALPSGVSLPCQFFRLMAVDLDWHLMGNRTAAAVNGVPGDDDKVPDFALPVVRPSVPNFDYLIDGMDVLGAAGQMAAGFPAPGASSFALAASPGFDLDLTVPPGPGVAGHWPAFPGPNPSTALQASSDATRNLSARFRAAADGPGANLDVIVTVAADVVPDGTHIRAFPRRFVEIRAIGEQPSFVRGDGGSGLAAAGQPTTILLVNPFGLASGAPLPSSAVLEIDLVIASRTGQRRLHSRIQVPVNATAAPFTGTLAVFGGTALLQRPDLNGLLGALGMRSISPVPLFGLSRPPPTGGAPGSIIDLVRRLASEESPRQGPRLPTQARFETVLAIGAVAAGNPALGWRAVVSGGRWTWETRCAQPENGDPGNPAGADVHATGVRCDGELAFDLALHTLKRAQPIIPLPSGGGPMTPGWIVACGGDNWNDPPADTTGTVAAVMLETIAPFCDSPELSALPVPQPTDTVQNVINGLATALGVPAPTINIAAEPKLRRRVQRESVTSKFGQRDALWALNRAFRQARELIYIEGPAFARTARPAGAPRAHEIDLVEVIRAQMHANPRLKVAICVPRVPDFAAEKERWVRTALGHRKQAIETLTSEDRKRVAAFHPIGFPGRPTAIRSTVVIVDDAWAMVGTSHLRRRGMTFDGGVDVASLDRSITDGYSAGIARFRQELMATKLGVPLATSPANTTAMWTRLRSPESAFDVLSDLLEQGGLGHVSPVWAGPPASDTSVIPQTDAVADPDGVDETGANLMSLFASLLIEG